VKKLQDHDVECSKMSKQMLTMKNEVVSQPERVIILFKAVSKKSVKDGISQFQNLCVNFYKFHALFSTIKITVRKDPRWVPKMLIDAHRMQRMAFALNFF
jgi:hypothetical protein